MEELGFFKNISSSSFICTNRSRMDAFVTKLDEYHLPFPAIAPPGFVLILLSLLGLGAIAIRKMDKG